MKMESVEKLKRFKFYMLHKVQLQQYMLVKFMLMRLLTDEKDVNKLLPAGRINYEAVFIYDDLKPLLEQVCNTPSLYRFAPRDVLSGFALMPDLELPEGKARKSLVDAINDFKTSLPTYYNPWYSSILDGNTAAELQSLLQTLSDTMYEELLKTLQGQIENRVPTKVESIQVKPVEPENSSESLEEAETKIIERRKKKFS